ncbi:hypothetical protein C4K39_4598 [Pseudomonas sessilinigenes]|nr:hypothetical protein C4K39_4598 [Pseudomonas sessilinigenes]
MDELFLGQVQEIQALAATLSKRAACCQGGAALVFFLR